MQTNTLIHGDCLEVMQKIPDKSIDMILTDLPYGITRNKWDEVILLEKLWEQYKRIIKDRGMICLTSAEPFTSMLIMSNPKMFKYDIIWDKGLSTSFLNAKRMPLRRHESILCFYKKLPVYNPKMITRGRVRKKGGLSEGQEHCPNYGKYMDKPSYSNTYYPTSILEISNAKREGKIHPTEKPVELFQYLIETYTNEGDVVLDSCSGSGTTAIACLNSNRQYICIEKDAEYFEKSKQRVELFQMVKNVIKKTNEEMGYVNEK